MDSLIVWAVFEWIIKLAAGVGALVAVIVAVVNYRAQTRLKQAEWVKSLFEKFFESPTYKVARVWLDYDELAGKLSAADERERRTNEETFTDFLNFFEFIGVLYGRHQLSGEQICEIFDYYLKKIKADPDCQRWIEKYSFEKLKALLVIV